MNQAYTGFVDNDRGANWHIGKNDDCSYSFAAHPKRSLAMELLLREVRL